MDSIKIALPFPPSSNTAYPTIIKGRKPVRVTSKKVKEWKEGCQDLSDIRINGRCTISYVLFLPDKRPRDGQNYLKVPLDYLVEQGVLEDDNLNHVIGEQWILGGIDNKNPRIEITIKEIRDDK